jgi:Ni2+-binding GTPase involved in maturation of urease and hydrogenase
MRIYVIDVAAGEKIPRKGGPSQFRKTVVHCGVMPASLITRAHLAVSCSM